MRDIPLELVVFALFGVAWLIQWAARFMRGRVVPAPPVQHECALPPAAALPARFTAPPPRSAGIAPAATPVFNPQPVPPARASGLRRFSRRALLGEGDRRTLQHAVVTAAILARCHAYRR